MLWQSCREGILLAGGLLWSLTCEPPATLGPPSLSVPTGLSVSFSAGLVTQPCNLTETPPFFFPSPGPSALALLPFPGPSTLALLPLRSWEAPRSGFCPLPKPGCRVQSYVHSEGCPSAPAHWPLCLTLEPREHSLLL